MSITQTAIAPVSESMVLLINLTRVWASFGWREEKEGNDPKWTCFYKQYDIFLTFLSPCHTSPFRRHVRPWKRGDNLQAASICLMQLCLSPVSCLFLFNLGNVHRKSGQTLTSDMNDDLFSSIFLRNTALSLCNKQFGGSP